MTLHAEVMPQAQQEVLRLLAPAAVEQGFYLGGGTAVAIHLGHRRSVDLDWFTEHSFPDPMRLASLLRERGIDLEPGLVDKGTLHGTAGGVRLSFLEYRYPLLQGPTEWPDFQCRLAHPDDLACMKLSAIANRGAKKDFIDLFALGQSGYDLAKMLDLYQARFQTREVGHVLFSLTYFEDAEPEEMPEMLWNASWEQVKRAIEAWVRDLARRPTAAPGPA